MKSINNENNNKSLLALPKAQGLYDPKNEHDACGFGFIANIYNQPKHEIVHQALEIVHNLDHRGAKGADPLAGDGAGILIQIPHEFFKSELKKMKNILPSIGEYGVGMVFLPREPQKQNIVLKKITELVKRERQILIGWRDVPVNNSVLGESVKKNEPCIKQFFIKKESNSISEYQFQRTLYVIRKKVEIEIKKIKEFNWQDFYLVSLSSRTIIYKGMVLATNLSKYYIDFQNKSFATAMALFHQRFSTNTFPSWRLAQPFRYLCHNGEINTLRGNINWINARKKNLRSKTLGQDVKNIWPIIEDNPSDSAAFDNALELLIMGGYSLSHAMMLMIPEAWKNNNLIKPDRKAFYEYFSALMEPWDGPAAMAFTDGRQIAATLDRNGLRPARYIITDDGLVIMASEVGVLPNISEKKIIKKWRLQPGKMLLVDLEQNRIISDDELKDDLIKQFPYRKWLDENKVSLASNTLDRVSKTIDRETLIKNQKAFGYNNEDIKFFLEPMIKDSQDPVGSMGRDIPLAVLSNRTRSLFDYFFQNFAQVTNPPIDPIREELVMSLVSLIGPKPNLLDLRSGSKLKRLEVENPILTELDLAKIKNLSKHSEGNFKTFTVSICYKKTSDHKNNMKAAIENICKKSEKLIQNQGCNILVLSDQQQDEKNIAIPSLLATSAVHHYLIRRGLRTDVGLIVETGEARRVHDMCMLAGYGAEAINPYLAFSSVSYLAIRNKIDETLAKKQYVKALCKGILKVMSKMGISTFQSYCGAQIFDCVGLSKDLVDYYFTGTSTKIEGLNLNQIEIETEKKHSSAYEESVFNQNELDIGGDLAFRLNGEHHVWTPETISKLQHSVRSGNYHLFKEYSKTVNDQSEKHKNLRGQFKFIPSQNNIPLNEVESLSKIVKRFSTGAMSFGSISEEAHTTLAIAMNRLGGRSNTGEGGEDPLRYKTLQNGDSMKSKIKQVASGRFGVTTEYLVNAEDIQIKMAQGAKPGEGGQLPGHKVDKFIAKIRHSTPGVGLISPPPHHDIYSIEDLAQLIYDLKNVNPKARISVKLVSEVGVGTVAAGVSKAHADHVTISGHDGGTGASPLTSVLNAGGPWELGLAETHQTLVLNNLRGRISVQVDGGLRTGRDVVIGAILGADEFGFATSALISEGCIMMRKCHLNTCPVGVATQDPDLRKNFIGKPEHVVNFFRFIASEVREILAYLGYRSLNEVIGQKQLLNFQVAKNHWKSNGIDLSKLIYPISSPNDVKIFNSDKQEHNLHLSLDKKIIKSVFNLLDLKKKIKLKFSIRNTNRTVGAMLSGKLTKIYEQKRIKSDLINIKFTGNAGQSFGAWLAKGINFELEGDANDYVGKGLSGGKIVIYPSTNSLIKSNENIIVGNTVLYGAISGECYFSGVAGERFAVRNSGALAVVEGCGDHGCEYMTGGIVVILGETGQNFSAGMSGGIAYVLDEKNNFNNLCNLGMVKIEKIDIQKKSKDFINKDITSNLLNFDEQRLKLIIQRHFKYSKSLKAKEILDNWGFYIRKFIKVVPMDFEKALINMESEQSKKKFKRKVVGE